MNNITKWFIMRRIQNWKWENYLVLSKMFNNSGRKSIFIFNLVDIELLLDEFAKKISLSLIIHEHSLDCWWKLKFCNICYCMNIKFFALLSKQIKMLRWLVRLFSLHNLHNVLALSKTFNVALFADFKWKRKIHCD